MSKQEGKSESSESWGKYFDDLRRKQETEYQRRKTEYETSKQELDQAIKVLPTQEMRHICSLLKLAYSDDMIREGNHLVTLTSLAMVGLTLDYQETKLNSIMAQLEGLGVVKKELKETKKLVAKRERLFGSIQSLYKQQEESRKKMLSYVTR